MIHDEVWADIWKNVLITIATFGAFVLKVFEEDATTFLLDSWLFIWAAQKIRRAIDF